jgi:hypothetical protein
MLLLKDEFLFHLTDAAETPKGESPPRCGDRVELRRGRGAMVEAWSAAGRRLGRLPPAESGLVAGILAEAGRPMQGRISAVVPQPRLSGPGRIHIRVSRG